MRKLVLIRHAKSSWKYDVTDINRGLNDRGFRDANLVSRKFKTHNFYPDIVFSSPAKRALLTCNIFMDSLELPQKLLKIEEKLYDFDGQNVISFIKSIDDNYKNIMIFGHNHAFTSICNIFGDVYIDNLPTSGLVMIDFNSNSWKTIDKGETTFTLFPKELK